MSIFCHLPRGHLADSVVAKTVRFILLALTLALLAAIAVCALAPSSYMTELPFIPQWLGEWADRNPNFRNMPVFAIFSALLFFVWSLLFPTSDIRPPASGLSHLPTSDPTSYPRLATRYGRWRLAFGAFLATALLGILFEVAQILIPGRVADWHDVLWASLGALTGAFLGVLALMLNPRPAAMATAD